MPDRKRAPKRSTKSGRYRVENPRGIPQGVPVLTGPDGKQYREGDIVSADNMTKAALVAWRKRGQVKDA